jgi:hypothetical protein
MAVVPETYFETEPGERDTDRALFRANESAATMENFLLAACGGDEKAALRRAAMIIRQTHQLGMAGYDLAMKSAAFEACVNGYLDEHEAMSFRVNHLKEIVCDAHD